VKNPVRNLFWCVRTWRALRRYPGLFSVADAAMQIDRVLLPWRFYSRPFGRALAREAEIESLPGSIWRIRLRERGLSFFRSEPPTSNLHILIEQEYCARNPHCYTTPPAHLQPDSLVLDVGACEGLFAFRALKSGLARRVICFEPWGPMAELIARGAAENGLADKLTIETCAVTKSSGSVSFHVGANAEANRIVLTNESDAKKVPAMSLDDYCATRQLQPTSRDLIKIDAEGADFDILLGAEQVIRKGGPQIAVTTYHDDRHCFDIVDWLKKIQPAYRMRLKGFSFWTDRPRPVLLQAAL
jgi:FkbM family methyltransferase